MLGNIYNNPDLISENITALKNSFKVTKPYSIHRTLDGHIPKLNKEFTDKLEIALVTNDLSSFSVEEARLVIQFLEWQNYLLESNVIPNSEEDTYISPTNEKEVLVQINNWFVDSVSSESNV